VTEFGNTLGTQDKHTECMLKHTITGMRQRSALTGGWRQHHILLVKHLSVIQPAQQAVCVHKCVEELLCVSRQALSQYIVVREIHRIFFFKLLHWSSCLSSHSTLTNRIFLNLPCC